MDKSILEATAKAMVAKGKGILAADESNGTCNKRFVANGIPETEEMRRQWRELLFTAPSVSEYLSGVILYDETIRQSSADAIPFPKLLSAKGIMPGIKVDKGTVDLLGFPNEKITEGLDGLRARMEEYAALGAKFAKWRAVITIGNDLPSSTCLRTNAVVMGLYANICQSVNIVPIVEPEVLLDGNHGIEKAESVTRETLKVLFEELKALNVFLPGLILKTSMVVPGKDSGEKMDATDVALRTARMLKETVPEETGGVVFLSGGQSSFDSTLNLNEIAKAGPFPWGVTFSFSRGLQNEALAYWKGKEENKSEAQALFDKRLKFASLASIGTYEKSLEA